MSLTLPSRSPQPLASVADPAAVSEALTEAGLRPGGAPPVVLERGWPLPKVPLMLRFADPDINGQLRLWWSLYQVGPQLSTSSLQSALDRGRASYLEDLQAIAQAFPADPKLTGLEFAITPKTALPQLLAGLPGEYGDGEKVTAQILSYKPSRRLTIRYRLSHSAAESRTLFAKCLPNGADQEVLALHQALEHELGCGRQEILALPRIVGRVPAWNMLLWNRQSGESIFHKLGTPEFGIATARAGHCLAELHGSSTGWHRVHDRSRELVTLSSWITATETAFPKLGLSLRLGLQALRAAEAKCGAGPLVPAHRDFFDKQIILDGERAALLDLETAARAEPELDVGNFLAHLELRALQGRLFDVASLESAFLHTYSRRFRRPDPTRLTWYKAATLLRLACVYSFRSEWVEISDHLRDTAHRAVSGNEKSWR